MPDSTKKNKIRKLKKAFFLVIIYGILFIFADIIFALILIPSVEGIHHPYYHHDLKKNQKMFAKWGAAETWIYTNSLGFKDSAIRDVPLTSDKYRILLIGDSFTEGIGYSFKETFAGMFSRQLAKKNPTVEVFNAGVKSYSPKLYFLKTKYLIENVGFKFEELVVFIDISDIQDEVKYKDFVPAKNLSATRRLDIFLDKKSYCFNRARIAFLNKETMYAIKNFFSNNKEPEKPKSTVEKVFHSNNAENFNINDFFQNYYKERPKWTFDEIIYKKWGKIGLTLALENMQKLADLCVEHKVKLTIAVYPWPDQIAKKDMNCRQVTVWKKFAQKNKIGFIDYFPLFINATPAEKMIEENFIKGDNHWNKKGHKIIADELMKIIGAELTFIYE